MRWSLVTGATACHRLIEANQRSAALDHEVAQLRREEHMCEWKIPLIFVL